ncbi:MAG: DNA repair protein RecN [Lachnospiraceae bacterium]|nr:DNA repair protein RecN [Lachnospiraceae bacterium]
MLVSLHVKNLALIEESEVLFGPGLNILTGETGAGKSILIGSLSLALGAKADRDLIRSGAEYAFVELVFQSEDPQFLSKMEELDLPVEEDGTVIISRKIQAARSVSKINGETVTARQIKELAELLLDIHGQHEHQSLLQKKKHMEILDAYAGQEILPVLEQITSLHGACRKLQEQLESESLDENARKREMELAQFEWNEIDGAHITPGEDEQLESRYRKMVNGKKIGEALSAAYAGTGYDSGEGAGSQIGRALRELRSVASYDEKLEQLESQLLEIDSLLNDFNRDMSEYIEDLEFDDSDFKTVEERLNLLNHLKGKYGSSLEQVLAYGAECENKIEKLADYENYMEGLRKTLSEKESELSKWCEKATAIRKKHASSLQEVLKKALEELNFLSVQFEVAVTAKTVGPKGADDVEFMISTNPGENLKPLVQVASGGELSRVMLAIKTVLADKDAVDTLIFDEIDSGISGKTAWKVAEKLGTLGKSHQVICITHLAQIAAMADSHFVIEKDTDGSSTVTAIRELEEEASLGELARLLGSDVLTEAALTNAREMRMQALQQKGK